MTENKASGPITDFIYLVSQITAGGDCSCEIKRCLLLGRKAITNLDSILKSRDITLPTKPHIAKSMIFPVAMNGCESWTIKKAEHQRMDAFELWCWRRLLQSVLDCKEIQPVHPKGNQSRIFIGKTDAEAETPILWPSDVKNWFTGKDSDTGKDWRHQGEGDNRGWDGWMASRTQWTWVWVGSGSWWWTGKTGVLQSMGSQSWTWLSHWTGVGCGPIPGTLHPFPTIAGLIFPLISKWNYPAYTN